MLVHEARARFKGRAPEFGNAEDRQAVVLLSLYDEAAAEARLRHSSADPLEKTLQDFEWFDAPALERYLHPRLACKSGGRRGR